MIVYFMRHAHAIRKDGITNEDEGLSPLGISQALSTVPLIRSLNITSVVSSPYRRAIETASIICDALPELEFSVDSRFAELSLGTLEGKKLSDVKKELNINISKRELLFKEASSITSNYGVESYDNAVARVVDGIMPLPTNTLVITHGEVIRSLLSHTLKNNSPLRNNYQVAHCSIHVYNKQSLSFHPLNN
ncbi:MAG: histidine phosphatase family protein [Methanobacteriota archaeon]|nr:MAG: histidine phosphatase family protein [Euryarchaeota archaeon]